MSAKQSVLYLTTSVDVTSNVVDKRIWAFFGIIFLYYMFFCWNPDWLNFNVLRQIIDDVNNLFCWASSTDKLKGSLLNALITEYKLLAATDFQRRVHWLRTITFTLRTIIRNRDCQIYQRTDIFTNRIRMPRIFYTNQNCR